MELIAFILGSLISVSIIVHYNIRYGRAVRSLEEAFFNDGQVWNYQREIRFRMKMFSDPDSIITSVDSITVRNAKQQLIAVRLTMGRSIKDAVIVLVGTVVIGIIVGLLEFTVRVK